MGNFGSLSYLCEKMKPVTEEQSLKFKKEVKKKMQSRTRPGK